MSLLAALNMKSLIMVKIHTNGPGLFWQEPGTNHVYVTTQGVLGGD